MHRNIYDLSHNYMFVSLLQKDLKKEFLNYLNEEAYDAYKYILDIDEEFLIYENEAKYKIIAPFSYYSTLEDEIVKYSLDLKKKSSQKFLFFYSKDDDRKIDLEKYKLNFNDFFLFKTGGFKTESRSNIFGMPYIVKDYFSGTYSDKNLSLSYCGMPYNHPFKEYIIDRVINFKYSDFIIRKNWCGDNSFLFGLDKESSYNLGPSKKSKKEYIDNIERNLYGLSVRGVNNSSYRLYDIFMMGRIPVLLNTNCILPFENKIPYKKNSIFIEDFNDIDKQIRIFHDSHTKEELLNIQKENRNIWVKYFRVDGAYRETKKLLNTLNFNYQ